MEITVRDKEIQKRLLNEGINGLVSYDIAQDYYVDDVDVFEGQTIIYMKEKHSANNKDTNNTAWTDRIRARKLSRDEEFRSFFASGTSLSVLPTNDTTNRQLERYCYRHGEHTEFRPCSACTEKSDRS